MLKINQENSNIMNEIRQEIMTLQLNNSSIKEIGKKLNFISKLTKKEHKINQLEKSSSVLYSNLKSKSNHLVFINFKFSIIN